VAHSQGAAPLLSEIRTLADPDVAVVTERRLQIDAATSVDIVVTDLGTQANPPNPLDSVRVALTRGTELVRLIAATGTTSGIDLTPGEYFVRIVGKPNATSRVGTVGVAVRSAAGGADLLSFSSALSLTPPLLPSNSQVLDAQIVLPQAGTYELSLVDLQFPQATTTLTAALVQTGGQVQVPGFPLLSSGTRQFTAAAGNYSLFVLASTAADVRAGLFAVTIRDLATATTVYETVRTIGRVRQVGAVAVPAGAATIGFTDLAFPAALTRRSLLILRQGKEVVRTLATGETNFTSAGGAHIVYVLAEPSMSVGQGSYGVRLLSGASLLLSRAELVRESGAAFVFSYNAVVANAGGYRVRVTDFQFPADLNSMRVLVTQGGAALGEMTGSGSLDLPSVAAQPVFLLVLAQPTAQAGVFGLDLSSTGAVTTPTFEINQGVGALFSTQRVPISTTARYNIALRDLQFPTAFAELFAVVTRGTERIGSIINGGTFSIDATPGSYFVSFLARPSAESAGTYALTLLQAPPAPVINLTANATSVQTGNTVNLSWSTQNASSCAATGGWSGSRATSGSETSAAITASTTFTLTCTGDGGSNNASVVVGIAPPQQSGGGGGAIEIWFLAVLFAVAALRHARHRWQKQR
jgi:hypothetical protein